MKKVLVLIISLNAVLANAQTYSTVVIKTPNQTAFNASSLVSGDLTVAQKNDAKDFWLSCYNNRITYKGEATYKYNCHAYAWHVSEGGNQVWINTPNDDLYWQDCSYIEVANQSNATKVSFGGPCYQDWTTCNGTSYSNPCDHSAITTSNADYFISKWGASPLFLHHKNDCPYSTQDLHFYTPVFISGSQVICAVGTSFAVNSPPGSTVSWSSSSNISFDQLPGNPKMFTANGNGAGWLQATINSTTCGQVTLPQKVVWIGPPNNSLISAMVMQGPPAGNQLCLNSYMTIAAGHSAIAAQGVTSYSWGFGNWAPYFQEYSLAPGPLQARPVFYLPTGAPSSQVLKVSAQNGCYPNTAPPFQKTFYAITCGYSLVFSPNPANDNTEVTLTNTDETDIVAYTVKVTNNSGQALFVDKKSGKRFTLPTSSLKDGLYIVEVVKGNEVYRENLVVKH